MECMPAHDRPDGWVRHSHLRAATGLSFAPLAARHILCCIKPVRSPRCVATRVMRRVTRRITRRVAVARRVGQERQRMRRLTGDGRCDARDGRERVGAGSQRPEPGALDDPSWNHAWILGMPSRILWAMQVGVDTLLDVPGPQLAPEPTAGATAAQDTTSHLSSGVSSGTQRAAPTSSHAG